MKMMIVALYHIVVVADSVHRHHSFASFDAWQSSSSFTLMMMSAEYLLRLQSI